MKEKLLKLQQVTFDEHIIKFGYEQEDLESIDSTMQSGGNYYL